MNSCSESCQYLSLSLNTWFEIFLIFFFFKFRYCKEEPFSVVSLDIRNMSRLQESLEAYVRGELLEGADAYYCDKCSKKVCCFFIGYFFFHSDFIDFQQINKQAHLYRYSLFILNMTWHNITIISKCQHITP